MATTISSGDSLKALGQLIIALRMDWSRIRKSKRETESNDRRCSRRRRQAKVGERREGRRETNAELHMYVTRDCMMQGCRTRAIALSDAPGGWETWG